MEKIIRFLIERKVFSFFLMIVFFVAGVYSAFKIPRESQPEVNAPFVIIKTVYQGSKALDIEKEITDEIEKEIENIEDIKNISSISSDNFSSVSIEFNQDVDIEKKEDEVQKAINKIKFIFPDDASESEVFKVEVSNKPIFVFAISSNENDFIFKKKSDKLKEDLEKIEGVAKVTYSGVSEYQYSLYLDSKKIKFYDISPLQIFSILKKTDISIPVGSLELDNINYPIEINSKIKNIEDLEKIVLLKKKDSLIYLSDVASIKKEFKKENNFSTTFIKKENEEKRSAVFFVKKNNGYNVEKVVDKIKFFLEQENKKIEKNINNTDNTFFKKENITVLSDKGALVEKDLRNLSKNGLITVIIVFVLLLFILGFKDSLVAAFGIPFSFALAFIAFLFFGNTLNFISLFSLILAIGILVDSDIVMSEGIHKRREEGMNNDDASIMAVKDLATPMIAGTLTTVAVFAPLFFLSGTTGEFIKSIPFTIIFVIIASQFVSIFAIPVLHAANYNKFLKFLKFIFKLFLLTYLFYFIFDFIKKIYSYFIFDKILELNFKIEFDLKIFLFSFLFSIIILSYFIFRKNKNNIFKKEEKVLLKLKQKIFKNKIKKENNEKTFFKKIEDKYENYLLYILKRKWTKFLLIIIAFLLFAFAIYLPKSGKVKSEFFPGGEVLFLNVNVSMPEGTTKKNTKKYILKIVDSLKKEKEITALISTTGTTSIFSKTIKTGDNYGNIFLKLAKSAQEDGQNFTSKIQNKIQNENFKYAVVEKSENGPPTGAPISFNIVGKNQKKVQEFSLKAEKILENIDGVVNIESDLEKKKTSIYFNIDKEKAKILEINESDIYTIIRMTTEGVEVFDIYDKFVDDNIPVVILNNENNSDNLEEFKKISPDEILNLKVKNNLGEDVFLSEFITVKLNKYQSKIYHYNSKNSIKIEAENKNNFNLKEIVSEFKEEFSKINKDEEVELIFGGAFSKQQKNFAETLVIFLVGIVIIFAILIFYFNSIWLPILIESVILFAYTGSTIGLWLTNNSISFPSMIGLIALSGVVVNNSIMLIHNYIEKEKRYNKKTEDENKKQIKERIVVNGSKERIRPILLTVLTTVIGIYPLVFSSPVWAPIAYVIIFGLLFSTFVTLLFIPVVYFWTYDLFTQKEK